ncbi:MAG: ribosome maturation factor RimP [Acidimicrobiia bacterium]
MSQPDAVASVIEPVLAARGLELVDVEVKGSGRARTLRVVVDRDGGVDLDGLSAASEVISPLLDGIGDSGVSGSYTLEVTSPGLERSLRRPDHFRRAVGEKVVVKTADPEPLRHRGTLIAADDSGIDVTVDGATVHLSYDAIRDARTVFEWGPQPKPGGARQKASHT